MGEWESSRFLILLATGPLHSTLEDVKIYPLTLHEDSRGWLLKILMQPQIPGDKTFGEIYVTVARSGAVKGGHYHKTATEWFCVIQGKGKLTLQERDSGRRMEIFMGEDGPKDKRPSPFGVLIPPNIIHAIRNIGEEPLYLLVYTDKVYDPSDTIPYDLET